MNSLRKKIILIGYLSLFLPISVFADIEDQFFGLDLEDVRRKITDKTVAIMPVH